MEEKESKQDLDVSTEKTSAVFKIWPFNGLPILVDEVDSDLDKNEQPWKLRRVSGKGKHTFRAYRLNLNPREMDEIIVERMLGRPLSKGEQIIHIDGDYINNTRCNLLVLTSKEAKAYKQEHNIL